MNLNTHQDRLAWVVSLYDRMRLLNRNKETSRYFLRHLIQVPTKELARLVTTENVLSVETWVEDKTRNLAEYFPDTSYSVFFVHPERTGVIESAIFAYCSNDPFRDWSVRKASRLRAYLAEQQHGKFLLDVRRFGEDIQDEIETALAGLHPRFPEIKETPFIL